MRAHRKIATSAGVLVLAGSLLLAVPAHAEQSQQLGAKSCSAGGVGSQARGTGTQTHYHTSGDYKSFANSYTTYVTRSYYSGLRSVSNARVYTTGAFSSSSWSLFCDY